MMKRKIKKISNKKILIIFYQMKKLKRMKLKNLIYYTHLLINIKKELLPDRKINKNILYYIK